MTIGIILGGLGLVVLILVLLGVKIVPQTIVYVVERLGSFRKILTNGVNWIIPFFDKIIIKESLKERVLDFPAQDVITKDNVTMKIDTVVYMQITDAKLYAYGVEKPINAVENLTATTLRNLVGDLELDQTLTSRDTVNEQLRRILDDATDMWGIKILRVELKNILPPEDIRRAMEKQMRAEREKREQILVAEGTKSADILRAEGEKAATILNAEASKEQKILEAEGKKEAIILLNESVPSKEALLLKSYEAMENISQGEATTILLPTDMSNLSSAIATLGTVFSKTQKKGVQKRKVSRSKAETAAGHLSSKEKLSTIIDKIKNKK